MLSLNRTLRELDETEERVRSWWEAYSGVLTAAEGASTELSGDKTTRELIMKARIGVDLHSEPDHVRESGVAAQQAIETLAHGLVEARTIREREFKKIIWITAEAGEALVRTGNSHADEIRQFAAKVEEASCLESVVEIRCQMTKRLGELNAVARRIQEDNARHADSLNRQIERIQERLKAAESLAETDVLTNLGNRRLVERRIAVEIEAQNRFCVVVLDLDGFKGVNDRFGHAQGDRLLQSVAASLSDSVRGTDTIGRWGGDEFVLVLHGVGLAEAETRVSQIQQKVFGEFILPDGPKQIKVQVSACFGIAECRPGESADELFERADRHLYELKEARHESNKSKQHASNFPVLAEVRF